MVLIAACGSRNGDPATSPSFKLLPVDGLTKSVIPVSGRHGPGSLTSQTPLTESRTIVQFCFGHKIKVVNPETAMDFPRPESSFQTLIPKGAVNEAGAPTVKVN